MQQKQMSIEDLRESVDSNKVVEILTGFDKQPNIKALTTLACAIGLLVGSEAKESKNLVACLAAVNFIIYDSAQLAIREGSPLVGLKPAAPEKQTIN